MEPELIFGVALLKLISSMMFVHLEKPFGMNLIDSFQEVCKVYLRYPQTEAYKAGLCVKPCQMILIYLRKMT